MSANEAVETVETFHIIGVDPGLICGVAVLTVAIAPYINGGFALTMSTSERPWLDTVAYVHGWLKTNESMYPGGRRDTVYVRSERYDLPTGRSVVSAQQDAIKTNGALEYICSLCNVTFMLQPRAEVKKIVSDKLLHKLGWFKRTRDGHANDGARHAGFMLMQHRPELWLRLIDGV